MSTDNSSLLISIGIIVYCIFCFFQGKNGTAKKTYIIDDNYRLGYIDLEKENQTKQININVVAKDSNNLKQECIRIMVAIGYSESVAQQIVKDFFKKHTADSLEDFFVKINKPEFNSAD